MDQPSYIEAGVAGRFQITRVVGLLLFALLAIDSLWAPNYVAAQSPSEDLPSAVILNDHGGPVVINGEVSYTNAFFTIGTESPMVILEDQAGFVDRDEGYILPIESQTIGQITSDFYTSPFSYTISLPIQPQGGLRDVDNDEKDDIGVMVFAVAYWANVFGDPFLEERDLFGGGWSTTYASTKASNSAETNREIVGGTFLVYAPDEKQGFPAGFGDDRRLFTEDDPIVRLPQGYTIVKMDAEPFTFDRSRYPTVELLEPAGRELENFAQLAYDEAFDSLVDLLRDEYAFTEYKQLDWDELHATFRPRFETAETQKDELAFRRALRDFSFSIPDGHVRGPFVVEDFRYATGGGLGLAIRELDNGRVIANYVVEDGPADQAGIVAGAEIIAIDGTPIDEHVQETVALSGPFSTSHYERLQKLRYAVRWPLGSMVDVTYQNPIAEMPVTVSLSAEPDNESFSFSSFNVGLDGFQLPVEYAQLPSGYGYVKIYSFSDNKLLTVQLWERLIHTLKDKNIPGLIIDMRQNGGGSAFLADQMAAYFFNEALDLGSVGYYDEDLDEFYFDPHKAGRFYLPSADLRYDGAVAILAGPNCNSACEFFVYDMTLQDRAAVVGHYPTAGLGGSIDVALMPENIYFQYTVGRSVDQNGEVLIEGRGIAPTLRVPVNETALLGTGDPELEAAIHHLDGLTEIRFINAGKLKLGRSVTGKLKPNVRVRYTLPMQAGDVLDVRLEDSTGRLDTILRLYDLNETLLASNDDAESHETVNSTIEHFEIPIDLTLIVEAATYGDASSGDYLLSVEAGEPIAVVLPPTVASTQAESSEAEEGTQETTEVETTTEVVEEHSEDLGQGTTPAEGPAVDEGGIDAAVIDDETVTSTTDSPVPERATVRTEGARLSVRSGPGADNPRIGYVANGSSHQVAALSPDGTWIQIVLDAFEPSQGAEDQPDPAASDGRKVGWISVDYVELDPK